MQNLKKKEKKKKEIKYKWAIGPKIIKWKIFLGF